MKTKNMNSITFNSKKRPINPISLTVLLALIAISVLLFVFQYISIPVFVGLIIFSTFIAGSIYIADQWEKAIVLRMGKYNGMKGPGLFFIIPIIDKVDCYIDQRVRVTDFSAEETLTKDTVPVNVDAVVYWTVWDVEKAVLEVQEYQKAIGYMAQIGLRDIIGKHDKNIKTAIENEKTLSSKGLLRVKRYSWQKTANETISVYNEAS